MSSFRVQLKKVVDDSYDVQIGQNLIDTLIEDINNGLTQGKKKFAQWQHRSILLLPELCLLPRWKYHFPTHSR